MIKDPTLSGQCFDIETDEGANIELCLKPHRDHYVIEVRDGTTGQDIMGILNDDKKTLPEIYDVTTLNIVLQMLFEDEQNPPQIDEATGISDWEKGTDFDDLSDLEDKGKFLQDISAVVRDLQQSTLQEAIAQSGTDFYFRYGDNVVMEIKFRHSPKLED